MKLVMILLSIVLVVMNVYTQEPDWQWATQAGGSESDGGRGIAIDENGDCYVSGKFRETATFGSHTITGTANDWDIFIAKMDVNGNWLWVNSAGGFFGDNCLEIDIDSDGNSYITGDFRAIATFGSHSITSYGECDIFVAKMDSDGNWLWVTQAGGSEDDHGYGLAYNNSGSILVTGWFNETATFGASTFTSYGEEDIFVASLDTEGNWNWVNQVGSVQNDRGTAIATGNYDNAYVTGFYRDNINFGSFSLTPIAGNDIFVAKLDVDGNWLWAEKAGGNSMEEGYGIAADNNNNCYITGRFQETASFGSISLTSNGYYDIFVVMLNPDGEWIWAEQAGGIDADLGWGIVVDNYDEIYITGSFSETSTFGSHSLTSLGYQDAFVAKLTTLGIWYWVKPISGVYYNNCYGIDVDDNFDCYVAGQFTATAYVDPFSLTSLGEEDIIVAKLSAPSSVENEITPVDIKLSNYPNPFNPTTTIRFSLPSDTEMKLIVYNIKGQIVKILDSGVRSSGYHDVLWNGKDAAGKKVASGIYYYQLNTTENTVTDRMILLK